MIDRSWVFPGLGLLGLLIASLATADARGGRAAVSTGAMAERCRSLTAAHAEMQADLSTMDSRLEQKLAAMNAAEGEAKIAAMADVLNVLASQRKTLHERIARLQGAMLAGCPTASGASDDAATAGARPPR